MLHGWLGSWGLWQDTMAYLGRYYRTYALDFWGFGESGKKRETYAVQDFVSLVNQFMEQLGIMNAPLVGHSMGGTVSLSVAIRYPERVSKVVVVGSPIVGSSLAVPLKLAGYRPIAFMLFNMMGGFRLAMKMASPVICRDERFAEMMDRDLSPTKARHSQKKSNRSCVRLLLFEEPIFAPCLTRLRFPQWECTVTAT